MSPDNSAISQAVNLSQLPFPVDPSNTIIASTTTTARWGRSSDAWYRSRGYRRQDNQEEFSVIIFDLTPSSGLKIEVSCPVCGNNRAMKFCHLRTVKHTICHSCATSLSALAPIVGMRFGNLVVVERKGADTSRGAKYRCLCDCGSEVVYNGSSLRNGRANSCGCAARKRLSDRGKAQRGPLSPLWNPNLTDEERRNRRSTSKVNQWRAEVLRRDEFTCQVCGKADLADLVAHHLNGYTAFSAQRFEVRNGITLCKACHKAFHLWHGWGSKTAGSCTAQDFEAWRAIHLRR